MAVFYSSSQTYPLLPSYPLLACLEQKNRQTMQQLGVRGEPRQGPSEEEFPGRQTIEFMVPGHRAGLVIGHHGETLKRIEKMSQCRIQFDQQQQPIYQQQQNSDGVIPERRVIITGLPEDIEEAKRLIRERVEERRYQQERGGGPTGSASLSSSSSFPTQQMTVPQGRVGLIIGRGGETIRELQERSGAKITVQPEASADPHSPDRTINLTGDEEAIRRAKELIEDLLAGHSRPGTVGGGGGAPRNSTVIQVPETSVGALIGKRAESLRTLQNLSGCRIYVEPPAVPGAPFKDRREMDPSAPVEYRNVHLTGAPEQVAYAHKLIMERVAQNESSYYAAQAAAAAYDPANQPSTLYQNPAELMGASTTAPGGADYAQYYYQYYQQMAAGMGQAATTTDQVYDPTGAAHMTHSQQQAPPHHHHQQQQQQQQPPQGGYDYAAYYNAYYNPQGGDYNYQQ